MSAASPIPRRVQRARWLDPRLLLGVVLVLASVVIGVSVVSAADKTAPVWALRHDMAAGTMLTADDVKVVDVKLSDSEPVYLSAGSAVTGKQLSRPVASGELLAKVAVEPAGSSTTVTVPLEPGAAPKLTRGQRIELWLSTPRCPAVVVLEDAVVQDVQSGQGGLSARVEQNVVVRVASDQAERVVTALGIRDAQLRAAVVPNDATKGRERATEHDLSNCAGSA